MFIVELLQRYILEPNYISIIKFLGQKVVKLKKEISILFVLIVI